MNREIKFRFWLGHTKKMTYEHSLIEISNAHWDFTEDIIALQYTGLKDKNNIDIYEADEIQYDYYDAGLGKITFNGFVEYCIKNAAYGIKQKDEWHFFTEKIFPMQAKVTGNIYETKPQTITEKKIVN